MTSIATISAEPIWDAPHRLWSAISPIRESRSVDLFYFANIVSKGCPTLVEARVTEADEWVNIQLVLKPGDPKYACPLVGVPTVTTVELERPLGTRILLQLEGGQ